jgi:hypothetical protein
MAVPSGEIVGRPMHKRACGCLQEFQEYAVDRYRAQRLAKFQKTRCQVCVAKLVEEQRQSAPPPKGETFKQLPTGSHVVMTRGATGHWTGTLTVGAVTVEATADGPQSLPLALARKWLLVQAGKTS